MSLDEIKDELRRMTPAERTEVARLLLELNTETEAPTNAASFADAKNYVFDNYGELMRRLGNESPTVREVGLTDPGVREAMDKVFKEHHELFRRLAE